MFTLRRVKQLLSGTFSAQWRGDRSSFRCCVCWNTSSVLRSRFDTDGLGARMTQRIQLLVQPQQQRPKCQARTYRMAQYQVVDCLLWPVGATRVIRRVAGTYRTTAGSSAVRALTTTAAAAGALSRWCLAFGRKFCMLHIHFAIAVAMPQPAAG